jgi:Tfp pilus assembly protein PilF
MKWKLRPLRSGTPWVLLFILGFWVCATGVSSLAAQTSPSPWMKKVKQGVEKGFNLEEKEALILLREALEMDRENPVPHAYLAFAHLFFYELSFDEKDRQERKSIMDRYIRQALVIAEKRIETNPRDSEAYWGMAIAKLTLTRFYITERRYFAVAREARDVWECLEQVQALSPENHDVYFPMGILHYHIDHLPGLTRFLSSLFLVSADRERGLKELELASQRGYFFRELAQAELVSIYTHFEKKPHLALPLAKALREKFPRNYNLLFSLANLHSDLGRFPEALALAREIEMGIQSGLPPYRKELWPRYHLTMGKILFDQGQYEKAYPFFQRTHQETARYNARNRAWALVRLGMIHDLRKEREAAEKHYQAALEIEGAEGVAQTLARKYLKSPYTGAEKNSLLSPSAEKKAEIGRGKGGSP